jgi:2'-5' RNA ligase
MRLFIGVELPGGIKESAALVAERLRGQLEKAAPAVTVRWTPGSQYHITLWFIGEFDDRVAADVPAAIGAVPMETTGFDLVLAGCGAFPPSGLPRVLWIGVREGADGMELLYREVGRRLAPLGFLPERRAYHAHLTIARIKDAARNAWKPLREALGRESAEIGRCRVHAITLFRSRLSPRGASYEPLLRVPLS